MIHHFTRSQNSTASISPLCSILSSGEKTYHVTDADKANCLNGYLLSISSVDDINATLPLFYEKTNKVFDKIETTEKEVQDIGSLNLNKATGPDLISYKIIKRVSVAISKPLSILSNRFLKECDFPDDWKNSNVILLQKKGDANLPTNYRPISLLSCIGKIMERDGV